LPTLEICIERGMEERQLRQEVATVLGSLRDSCKSRNKGLTYEMRERLHTAKYNWAKYVCANFSVTTMSALEKLSKNVWGNRLPDKYREELLTHLSEHPSLFEDGGEVIEIFEGDPATSSEKEDGSEETVQVQIGGVKILLAKGSQLRLAEVASHALSVKGCKVTVSEIGGGILKDVLIES
jgi:hypothetical protein